MEEELRQAFFSFATFGNRIVHNDQVLMDSRSCQKLCRDSGLMGKQLNSTDVDIMFTRAKTKGERKISFEQFLSVLEMISTKLQRSHAEIAIQVSGSAPVANSSSLATPSPARKPTMARVERPGTASSSRSGSSAVETPSTTSSTSQSSNFGRAMPRLHPDWYEVLNPSKTCASDTYYYVNRKTQETTWTIPLLVPTSQVTPPPPPPPPAGAARKVGNRNETQKYPSAAPLAKQKPVSSRKAAPCGSSIEMEQKSDTIFDRLTDPKLYTGAHKHRFDAVTGKGKGLEGRDRPAKGVGVMPGTPKSAFKGSTNTGTDETVHSITQFLRS